MSCLTYYLHFNLISYKLDVCCIYIFFFWGVTLTFEHRRSPQGSYYQPTYQRQAYQYIDRGHRSVVYIYDWRVKDDGKVT